MILFKTIKAIISHPLTKDKKVQTVIKFFYWQMLSKLFKKNKIIKYGSTSKLIIKDGYTAATGCYYCGIIEFEIMGFILHFLIKDDLFIDVGANVGTFILLASGEKKAESIGFEPDLSAFKYLNENIELNRLNNVKTHNIGVSSELRTLKFTTGKGAMNHVSVDENEKCVNSQFDSIDNKCEINKPTIIKIDVEGYEKEVVLGMHATMKNKNLKAVIIECNTQNEKYDYSFSEIEAILLENGFDKYDYNPIKRELIELEVSNSLNVIFIRDFDFVEKRVKSSPKVKFNNVNF